MEQERVAAIRLDTPLPPPAWALLERELLRFEALACREFFSRYFDERGYLRCVVRWGGNDGPDDAIENLTDWPTLHLLGGPDFLLDLYKQGWEGHLRQYWVGSIGLFHRLSWAAAVEGLSVCKHTHGELGLAAAACHHVLLSLPKITDGHQQTAQMMEGDLLTEPLPIVQQPRWGVLSGPGLGVEVDEDKVEQWHRHYKERGQYLPYDPRQLGN